MHIGPWFYQSGFFCQSTPHYMILQGLIGQLNNHKVNYLHNLQTITMIVLVDVTVQGDGYITPIVIVCKLCK